jgi:hypothetical protein
VHESGKKRETRFIAPCADVDGTPYWLPLLSLDEPLAFEIRF